MTRLDTITVGRDQFRVGPWHDSTVVAYVALPPTVLKPSSGGVSQMLGRLRSLGYERVITAALREPEIPPFLDSGFGERERLSILSHDLTALPELDPTVKPRIRRPRPGERPCVLEIDASAFEIGWQLDRDALADALTATPRTRFRVAERHVRSDRRDRDSGDQFGGLAGYVVCGRAGDMGYLQRLAVESASQRAGIGQALVADSLRWLRRRGGRLALVNTQKSNTGAMRLYERCGFRREHQELIVLEMAL